MKADDLIQRKPGTAAGIARQLVRAAAETYVPEDVEQAVDSAISRFVKQLRDAAREEMQYVGKESLPKSAI